MGTARWMLGVLDGHLNFEVQASSVTHRERPVLFLRYENEGLIAFGESAALARPLPGEPSLDEVAEALKERSIHRLAATTASRGGHLPPAAVVASLFGTTPLERSVAHVVEMAVLDAELQESGRSLGSWLCATSTSVGIGGLVSVTEGDDLDTVGERVSRLLDSGASRIRVKIRPGFDLEPLKMIRIVAPKVLLQADANGAYRLEGDERDGPKALERLAEADLSLIEQPFAAANLVDHATLRSMISIPIALDEGVTGTQRVQQILRYGAADALCVKPGRLGGLAAAVEVLRMAAEHGVDAFVGGFFETGFARSTLIALAAAPGATLLSDLTSPSTYGLAGGVSYPAAVDGRLSVPTGPGVSGVDNSWLRDADIAWQPLGE